MSRPIRKLRSRLDLVSKEASNKASTKTVGQGSMRKRGLRNVTFEVDPQLWDALGHFCLEQKRTRRSVLEEGIRLVMERA